MEVSAPSSSDYTQVFHQHYDQVRQIQRELHSALQSHAKGRARRGQAHHPLEASVIDSPSEDSDPLAGIQLSKKELEVFNRLLNDEGGVLEPGAEDRHGATVDHSTERD